MRNITVIGTGYVGLVTGACFADMGHRVICVDVDEAKVAALRRGDVPIYEPGLEPVVQRNLHAGRLSATTSFKDALQDADFVFMCVGTPQSATGDIDLSYLHSAYVKVQEALPTRHPTIVNKSTVPPWTTDTMGAFLARLGNGHGAPAVVANPEFLREGHAVADFMRPPRVVIGSRDPEAAEAVAELYQPLGCPIVLTDPPTAEMIKYASNAFLATKISFINELSRMCDKLGIDVTQVAHGIGMDHRIGKDFLRAGIGYGGSCLPKDIAALIHLSRAVGHEPELLAAVASVNNQQPSYLVDRVEEQLDGLDGKKVGVLGVAFKPDTDDVRCSPALELIKVLLERGALVTAYDPEAWRRFKEIPSAVRMVRDMDLAVRDSDALIIATEWAEIKALDLREAKRLMRGNVLADGRNVLDPDEAKQAGFQYVGVGRSTATPQLADSIVLD